VHLIAVRAGTSLSRAVQNIP